MDEYLNVQIQNIFSKALLNSIGCLTPSVLWFYSDIEGFFQVWITGHNTLPIKVRNSAENLWPSKYSKINGLCLYRLAELHQ